MKRMAIILVLANIFAGHAQSNFLKGKYLYFQERYNEATRLFQQAVGEDGADCQTAFFLQCSLFKSNNADSAKLVYEEIRNGNSGCLINTVSEGLMLLSDNLYDEAYRIFARCSEKADKNNKSMICEMISIALLTNEKSDISLALKYIQQSIDANSQNDEPYYIKGVLLLKNGQGGPALNQFSNALYYNKNNVHAQQMTGRVFLYARNYNESLSNLQKALEMDSIYAPAYCDLGELYDLAKKYSLAAESYQKYLKIAGENEKYYLKYLHMLFQNKEFNDVYVAIKKMQNFDADNLKMSRLLAYSSFETGRYDESAKLINEIFAKKSNEDPIALDYEYSGKINEKKGNDTEAINNYTMAFNLDTTGIYLLEKIAALYEKNARYEEATNLWKVIISKRETILPSDLFLYGKVCYRYATDTLITKDSVKKNDLLIIADSCFSKVCELSPKSHLGYFWLARTCSALDPESSNGLAKNHYEKAIEIMMEKSEKFKKELIEAYNYLGYFYFLKKEKENSIDNWKNILKIEPENTIAITAIKECAKL